VRDGAALQPSASVELRRGDRVLLLADPEDLTTIERPFGPDSSA
jgi:Trk K+ transport system NAD-binding subunit